MMASFIVRDAERLGRNLALHVQVDVDEAFLDKYVLPSQSITDYSAPAYPATDLQGVIPCIITLISLESFCYLISLP